MRWPLNFAAEQLRKRVPRSGLNWNVWLLATREQLRATRHRRPSSHRAAEVQHDPPEGSGTGVAWRTATTVAPPGAHFPPTHVSTRQSPSDNSTSLAITPLEVMPSGSRTRTTVGSDFDIIGS